MTRAEAAAICSAMQLTARETAAYDVILVRLQDFATEAPRLNLFPLLMHFVSDGLAAQIAQLPLHAREGAIVADVEQVRQLLATLVLAKCVLAGSLEELGA